MTLVSPLVVGEIAFSRVMPGVLNLLTIVVIGRVLPVVDYGQFSLLLAAIALGAGVVIGPVDQAIVPLHARGSHAMGKERFEGAALGYTVVAVAGLAAPLTVLALFGLGHWSWVVWFAGAAFFRVLQPILRARLQFWRLGAAANAQALAGLALVQLFLPETPDTARAVLLYGAGLCIGACVAWGLIGFSVPRWPDRAFMKATVPVGAGLTLSSLAEGFLFLGARAVIALFGAAHFLGVFSFTADLVQRSVGVVINIAGFAILPRAYARSAQGDDGAFRNMLWRGALGAGGLSVFLFAAIMGLSHHGLGAKYLGPGFDQTVFIAVSIAVVVNRVKKLVVDPVLVSRGRVRAIPLAYIVVGPPGLFAMAVALFKGSEPMVLAVYAACFVLVALLSRAALRGDGWGRGGAA